MGVLRFDEVVEYVGEYSRPLVTGYQMIGNIITFGVLEDEDTKCTFLGLCMSESRPKENAYEVRVMVDKINGGFKCTCNCVGGTTTHCKHAVGFLLLLAQ